MLTELAPASAAVASADLAAHLRLPEGFEDEADGLAAVAPYALAATAAVEGLTGRALVARRFKWTVTSWRGDRPVIPVAPVRFIASVTLVDAKGGWETVDPSLYGLVPDDFTPRIAPTGACMPAILRGGVAEIEIEAGYGAEVAAVPGDLRHAVLILATHYYEQRCVTADDVDEVPFGVRALLARYRQVRL